MWPMSTLAFGSHHSMFKKNEPGDSVEGGEQLTQPSLLAKSVFTVPTSV